MKKSKILLAVIMATGIITGVYHTNAYAKVSSYILKDTVSNKFYQYDIKDIQSNINLPLFFEFMNNFRDSNKVMVHDDETGKYVNYEEVKKSFNNKNQVIDIDKICQNAVAEKEPFYVYHRINKNGQLENELNLTKNNSEIDFDIFQLKEANDIRISGSNFNISNLETKNEVILTPAKNGVVTLNNVKAKNIKVIGAGENDIKLINVQADSLQIDGNAKISVDGKFVEVKVNKKCEMDLSKNTVINKFYASDNIVIKGSNKAKIESLVGSKNVKNSDNINIVKIDTIISVSKHNGNKPSNQGESKPSTTVNNTSSSSSSTGKYKEKPDATTSASKHNGNKPSNQGESKPSTTVNNTSSSSSSTGKHKEKPDTTTLASKKDLSASGEKDGKETNNTNNTSSNTSDSISTTDKENIFQIIDKEHTCIMNIHYVNYAVIVIKEGTYSDYDFYIDGKKVNVQRVNKEGSVVKVELNNRSDKKLMIQKGQEKEEMTLKYKHF
ncbi:hypothetical protein IRP63_04775 [Clostridium botulinum]|uniref:Adhesin domain-containing protein n=2 Tax=Clostridium botulinum TaxID=1491 RepID=A0A0A0IFJ4_CLOBO|nr:hypothetical protein [Clostridium botulinum]KGN00215.1 hypothetical protein Z955_04255 [Clostridium botulinum C/D str. DC5]KOC51695.1 hypothetical protein ADU89_12890 [Clostridium botulinum]KOC54775.1 hypothetical protein ADU90_12165 [Clostridium botulinum]MCD3233500.1 hypothetical protein [Clostridium botulinum D/C]MCD3239250.1 hypothetical protein [Clostridium botulinum D/C]